MCKEGFVQYKCGCIGRQLGLEKCRYMKKVEELRAEGKSSSDFEVITNSRQCDNHSGDKYYKRDHDCRKCQKKPKK